MDYKKRKQKVNLHKVIQEQTAEVTKRNYRNHNKLLQTQNEIEINKANNLFMETTYMRPKVKHVTEKVK